MTTLPVPRLLVPEVLPAERELGPRRVLPLRAAPIATAEPDSAWFEPMAPRLVLAAVAGGYGRWPTWPVGGVLDVYG